MTFVEYKKGTSNLVLSMPHSAVTIPQGIEHHLNLSDYAVRKTVTSGIDLCVPFVTGIDEYTSAARIYPTVPRTVIDCNRVVSQADHLAVEGGNTELDAHGMIWRATKTTPPRDMLIYPYSQDEFQQLLDQVYHPFIEYNRDALDKAVERHGIGIRFDLHSMPANRVGHIESGRYKNAYAFGEAMKRGLLSEGKYPDLILLGDSMCGAGIRDKIIEVFSDHGLLIERMSLRKKMTSPADLVANGVDKHSIGIEIVGHNFEPQRMAGKLVYDNSKEKLFKDAFWNVFAELENYHRSS